MYTLPRTFPYFVVLKDGIQPVYSLPEAPPLMDHEGPDRRNMSSVNLENSLTFRHLFGTTACVLDENTCSNEEGSGSDGGGGGGGGGSGGLGGSETADGTGYGLGGSSIGDMRSSCDFCNRRKRRCNGERPCGGCIKAGNQDQCVYSAKRKVAKEVSECGKKEGCKPLAGVCALKGIGNNWPDGILS